MLSHRVQFLLAGVAAGVVATTTLEATITAAPTVPLNWQDTFDKNDAEAMSCLQSYSELISRGPQPTQLWLEEWFYSAVHEAVQARESRRSMDYSLEEVVRLNAGRLCILDIYPSMTPPPSLETAFDEYLSSLTSWMESVGPAATRAADECSAVSGLMSFMINSIGETDMDRCTSVMFKEYGLEVPATTTTSASTASDISGVPNVSGPPASSTTSTSTGGAARETGLAVAVAAGIIGAVVAL